MPTLNPTEHRVIQYIRLGKKNAEIAAATGLSEGYVKILTHRMYKKFSVRNRIEMIIAYKKILALPDDN